MAVTSRTGTLALAAAAAVLALIAWLGYSLFRNPWLPPRGALAAGGRPATGLAIRTANGEVSLADQKGKVVLIDFWATWCPPCRASVPRVERLYQAYRDRGFQVIGASLDDTDAVIPPFARRMGVTYPVGRLVDPTVTGGYGVAGIPTMVLVDRKGTVRWSASGFSEQTESELTGRIEALLAETA